MNIIADIRNSAHSHLSYTLYTIRLLEDLANADKERAWTLLTGRDQLYAESKLPVLHLKKSNFRWINKRLLKQLLKKQQCTCYIKIVNHSWEVYVSATGSNWMAIPGQPDKNIVFFQTNLQVNLSDNKEATIHTCYVKPAMPIQIATPSWAEIQSIKTQYTGGKDFFIFAGDIMEEYRLFDLLKAFSVFKKWQQSNMLLLIAGNSSSYAPVLEKLLATYKYRGDVIILKNPSIVVQEKLVAAAYALLHSAPAGYWPQPLMMAIRHRVAVIASDTAENRAITPAAIWINNDDLINEFSAAMQTLYKNEQQKQALIKEMTNEREDYNYNRLLKEINGCLS
jgi:glycosyltransferase involved in cell wall biosynthesis